MVLNESSIVKIGDDTAPFLFVFMLEDYKAPAEGQHTEPRMYFFRVSRFLFHWLRFLPASVGRPLPPSSFLKTLQITDRPTAKTLRVTDSPHENELVNLSWNGDRG